MKILIIAVVIGCTMGVGFKPVIGILTNPSDVKGFDSSKYSYFPSSYVKWIEQGGAIVVPIHWDSSYDEIETILSEVNGVLFTGGDVDLYINNTQPGYTFNKFTDTASYIFNKVVSFNKAGNYFPLIGTCQGFQLINYIVSGYYEVLTGVSDDLGKQRLLIPTNQQSQILNAITPDVLRYLTSVDGPYYSHKWGVIDDTYEKAPSLKSFFTITSYSTDGAGVRYIATIEGKTVPVYAWQFHPEKHAFEWRTKATHDEEHVLYGQQLSNFVIRLARKNKNEMSEESVNKKAIYNYPTTNRFDVPGTSFTEVYLIPRIKRETKLDKQKLGIRSVLHN